MPPRLRLSAPVTVRGMAAVCYLASGHDGEVVARLHVISSGACAHQPFGDGRGLALRGVGWGMMSDHQLLARSAHGHYPYQYFRGLMRAFSGTKIYAFFKKRGPGFLRVPVLQTSHHASRPATMSTLSRGQHPVAVEHLAHLARGQNRSVPFA